MTWPARARGLRAVAGPIRAILTAPILAAVVATSLAAPVAGHAQLLVLDPPDAATLEAAPAQVRLRFDEPVALPEDGLRVIGSDGRARDVGPEVVDRVEVVQPVGGLEDGWYLMTWGIVSEDGHIVRASSVFAVGDADAAARPELTDRAGATGLVALVARVIGDLGTLVAAGAAAAWWLLRARIRPVTSFLRIALATAIGGTLGWGAIQAVDGGSAWLATEFALATVVRLGLLVVALVATTRSLLPAGAAALLAGVSLAFGGHVTGSLAGSLAQAAHLLAASVWLGAAPTVLLVLHDRSVPDVDALGVVRPFSRAAAFAIVVVGVAGALLALHLSEGLAGGLSTWLAILGAKVVLVAVAIVAGAIGRRSLARDLGRDRFRWLFGLDAAIVIGVVVLSAALTQQPPTAAHADHSVRTNDPRCTTLVGERSVAVLATPGRIGSNELSVSGLAEGVREVALELGHALIEDAALTIELTLEDGAWRGSGALPFTGDWSTEVVVRVDTFTEARGACVLGISD